MVEELIGPIADDWHYLTLGEVCKRGGGDIQTGPFGSQLHASDYVSVGIPSIMPVNIGDNRIIEKGIARVRLSDAERLSRYRVRPGDIVYSRRGDVERRALVRIHEDGWLCGTGCLRVRVGRGIAVPEYVSYYLGAPAVREWIVRHAHGATMPNLNTSILSACPFVLPPLSEQQRIAAVLVDLDDKLELNRCMNETLEATARAIFKDWFVDFGPTRVKMEGQEPYLAPELWSLFPDRLDKEGNPDTWRIGRLDDVANIIMGASPDGSTYNDRGEGTPLVNGPVEYGDYFLRRIKWTTAPNKLSQRGDFIICVRGSTTGRHAFADGEYCLGRGVASIRGKKDQQAFVDNCILAHMDRLLQRTTGSVFPNLSSDDVGSFGILIPSDAARNAYCAFVLTMRVQVWQNVEQSETLAAIRDLLLPKLISGEIRVKDVEKIAAAA